MLIAKDIIYDLISIIIRFIDQSHSKIVWQCHSQDGDTKEKFIIFSFIHNQCCREFIEYCFQYWLKINTNIKNNYWQYQYQYQISRSIAISSQYLKKYWQYYQYQYNIAILTTLGPTKNLHRHSTAINTIVTIADICTLSN